MAILPTPDDGVETDTSLAQAATEDELAAIATGALTLRRDAHTQFLARALLQGFPARYQAYDASQPWLVYWTAQAFALLQVGLDDTNRAKLVHKIMQWQHPDGGFGGGPGQLAHLLATYAAVCSLAIVGRPGPGGGWDEIDRPKIYAWFMSLKQPDGSFTVSAGGEVDVRGTYCLLVVAALLDLLTPALAAGVPAALASCQTYEGGFASASQPSFAPGGALLPAPRPPLGEAHGGYTFCAAAAWALLRPHTRALPEDARPRLNTRALERWLAQMQGGGPDHGGFRGRTNKLVDGCYAWWVGGAFGLLGALGDGEESAPAPELLDRGALQEFVLLACQGAAGGLRDKPSKPADAYHTLYCLSGLAAAQHAVVPGATRRAQLEAVWAPSAHAHDALRKEVYLDALSWTTDTAREDVRGGAHNRLNATHPVFDLAMTHVEGIMGHFYGQTVPPRLT